MLRHWNHLLDISYYSYFDFKGVLPSMGMTIDEIREKGIAGGVDAYE